MPYRESSRANLRRNVPLKCTDCGQEFPREELVAKRCIWVRLVGNKSIRSRTVAHQCAACLVKDADWNRTRIEAPGLADVREKRNAQE